MTPKIVLVLAACSLAHGSGVGHLHSAAPVEVAPIAAFAAPPVVAAQSSQYFQRTFNRLVAAPLVPQPVFPVQPVAPVAPVAPPPQVFVHPVTRTVPAPVNPTQNVPSDPNVAVAIATAHASAPTATFLLPPYRFAPPPGFGFVQQVFVPEQRNETTTQPATTTVREPEPTTPFPQQPQPSNTDNSFAQAPPQNPNFQVKQNYGPPLNVQPLPKPQKLKTSVEVVPVPLRYIAPPPIPQHYHHHHHHHHHHGHPDKYVHSFIPAKLIVRPVHVHTVKVPARLVVHKVPVTKTFRSQQNVLRSRIDNASLCQGCRTNHI
ncbi:hypothetical protein O0L34_g18316 [Tuta absoluta]|nr:hypothetical protein O0L34_g18316 [Tuta absoluta]